MNHERELKRGYTDFFRFAMGLIETLDQKNGNLKFAVVNMQVALELFLKCFFLVRGMPERTFKDPSTRRIYKDFSDVLNSYYSLHRGTQLVEKEHLRVIMESRNEIVHRGRYDEWNDELAEYLIACAFFIQELSVKWFDQSLLEVGYHPNKLASNLIWKKEAERLAQKLAYRHDLPLRECPHCCGISLVPKEMFAMEAVYDHSDLQCLACFVDIDVNHSGTLLKCDLCGRDSYYLDILNEQPEQLFPGKCLSCGGSINVRKCAGCGSFYCPDLIASEHELNTRYFCHPSCAE